MGKKKFNINKFVNVPNATPSIKGYEFKKILDSDPNLFYAAAVENIPLPHFIEFSFDLPIKISEIEIIWESDNNYGRNYNINYLCEKSKQYIPLFKVNKNYNKRNHVFYFQQPVKISHIKLNVLETEGQKRMLIRNINFFSTIKNII